MMRLITPIILIGISVTIFFTFTNPIYNDISQLRTQIASYNQALDNSKALETERDALTAKYNSIDPDDLVKIQKLLPDSIDNIRLILEIGQIAAPYGMTLSDVQYDASPTPTTAAAPSTAVVGATQATTGQTASNDYGVWDLSFSTTGTYNNFLNFTKDLESNLRIVDISSISFSSDTGVATGSPLNPASSNSYTYAFKIKTYWLKS